MSSRLGRKVCPILKLENLDRMWPDKPRDDFYTCGSRARQHFVGEGGEVPIDIQVGTSLVSFLNHVKLHCRECTFLAGCHVLQVDHVARSRLV